MRKSQCLLFVLKRSYICYYIICMTVPLTSQTLSNRGGGEGGGEETLAQMKKNCCFGYNIIPVIAGSMKLQITNSSVVNSSFAHLPSLDRKVTPWNL